MKSLKREKITTVAVFIKPKQVIGNHLILRDANIEDSLFIIGLRTSDTKSKYISKTSKDLEQQITWLEEYQKDDSQIYFIIQNKNLEQVGTVRLYDQKLDSFCWGSWIIKAGVPSSYSIESALIVYHYALSLGFNQAHFKVRKGNESVWKFHERFGAVKIAESAEDYSFIISADNIKKSLEKYSKYLPAGINIIF